jgi:hypothetical protein
VRRLPPVSGCCRTVEKLVSVGEEDEGIFGVCGGEESDAHCEFWLCDVHVIVSDVVCLVEP